MSMVIPNTKNVNDGFWLHFEFVPLPCGAGSTVLLCLFTGVMWLWHFLYSVNPHPVSSIHIYTFVGLGHSLRVRLAKQETLTPPGYLVSPLVCRCPWMYTMVLYCWCHSDSASVLLYFTLRQTWINILFSTWVNLQHYILMCNYFGMTTVRFW